MRARTGCVALFALIVLASVVATAEPAWGVVQFSSKWGSLGTTDGQFSNPYGVATDASGDVYVADVSNERVQKFDATGAFITKWGVGGTSDGQFQNPTGVATDGSGYVYVADYSNQRIQKFDST